MCPPLSVLFRGLKRGKLKRGLVFWARSCTGGGSGRPASLHTTAVETAACAWPSPRVSGAVVRKKLLPEGPASPGMATAVQWDGHSHMEVSVQGLATM